MSFLSKITGSSIAKAVGHAAKSVEKTVGPAVAKQVDGMDAPKKAGEAALQKLFGPVFHAQANLPPYTKLPTQALADAKARSTGMTYVQRLARDGHGGPHEPVTLAVSGTLPELESTLEKAGWVQSENESPTADVRSALSLLTGNTALGKFVDVQDDASPMSTMYVGGQKQVAAFEKNNDHHQGRDHLRIFNSGKTDANGQPIWEIAATRDLAFNLNTQTLHATHQIDHHIDGERDMVMADLLGTGNVASWNVAQGEHPANVTDYLSRNYKTDGEVYVVALK